MHRIIYIVLLLLFSTSLSFAALNNKQISPIEKDITMYHSNSKGIPTFVSGNLRDKVVKGAELQAVHDYFEINKDRYQIQSPVDELQLLKTEIDELGMTHLRFKQRYKGLEVVGGDINAHFRNDGMFTSVNGTFNPIKNMNITAQVLASDALTRATDDLLIDFGVGTPTKPQLVIFPWQKETYLCWRFFIISDSPMGRWEYFIDATTGDIIFKANRIMNAEAVGSGTGVMGNSYNHIDTWDNGTDFEMIDYTRRASNNIHGHNGQMASGAFIRTYLATSALPGSVATDADNVWGGTTYAPAVDGHMYSVLFYDWMLREFGRNSYNNSGSSMNISVNYSAEGDNNAYWNGSQIVIWSWSTGWRSLAGCPDVVAHEWGHAVTETTSGLVYQLESGALNESFSDMIGAAFEFAHDTLDTPDWLMGENGTTSGSGFRDMLNPHSKSDPDFYGTSDPYWIDVVGCTPQQSNDWCGVHTNSSVGNRWFSLLSDGGLHYGVTVTGLGVDTAMMIAFRANTVYWTANIDYQNAAIGTISAAQDLDPSGNWEFQVAQAWNAVGVSTPAPSLAFSYPNGKPTTTTPLVDTTFDVVVSGSLGGVPISNTGQIYISINGGAYQSFSMPETSPNNYLATLPGSPCGDIIDYYFSADMVSPAVTVYDGSSSTPFTAVPSTGSLTVFTDDFETDLGWTISGGNWARGVPSGGGGAYGNPDPTSGTVGSSVMGYNLNGDYADNIPEYHVTSPAIDCSTISTARLQFDRWLGVEEPAYDHAYIRVSTNNTSWTTVWENSIEVADNAWTNMDIDISSIAALQSTVYIRFTMGTSDGGWTFCGWNIDDLRITGAECTAAPTVTITTTSLPNQTANLAFSQQLTATNNTGVLNWTDKNSDLSPTGLTLSTSGLLSGTVTSAQLISFTAMVTDDLSSDEKLLSFTINPVITTSNTSVPNWTESVLLSHQFTASGGTGTLVFADKNNDLTGSGLSVSSTGLLSGIPTAGNYSFTLLVTDSLGATNETIIPITINSAIAISNTNVSIWTEGLALSHQFTATGGTGQLIFSDKNNDLIGSGLTVSSSGLLSGTPTAGNFSFTLLVTDSVGATTETIVPFTINAVIVISNTTVPNWTEGIALSHQFSASGGTGALLYSDKNSDLSGSGLIVSSSGLLSGTPAAGNYSFTLLVTDSLGATTETIVPITINQPIVIVNTTVPDWTEAISLSHQFSATGGTGILVFTDKNNDLISSGLTVSASGLLTGIPIVGNYSFTLLVTDSLGANSETLVSVTINASVVISTLTLPDANVGVAYSQQINASGGTGSLAFTDKNNDLISTGFTLSSTGLLSGTSAITQTISFTVVATDSVGAFSEQFLSVTVTQEIIITPPSFPGWTAGVSFSEQIIATGGTGTLVFTDKNNDLVPSNLTLSTTGLLSGVPLGGTFNFICLVTDSLGGTKEQAMSVSINDSLKVVTSTLSDWTVGIAYSKQLIRSGGTGFVSFADKNNDLSGSGLTISSTGTLSGTVLLVGSYTFIVEISDAVGAVAEKQLTININDSVTITTTALPDGDSNTGYIQQLQSAGGTGVVTWVDKNNDFASTGLVLQSDGLITGIPVVIGNITFTAVATDDVGSTDEQPYTFEIFMGYVCGDIDNSGGIDISDLVFIINYMFSGGPAPPVLASMDVDGSGTIDISDVVYLVAYMFGVPQGPDPICGVPIQ